METRPDYIKEEELLEMRELGCTRVEIGVQAIDDKILKLNKRGHDVNAIIKATKILRQFGFKITYHFMPGLPGSNPKKDLQMFRELFFSPDFQPDQIKFYPTVVTKGSLIYKWWKQGKYKPYTTKTLENLIIKCKKIIPPYVRIIRLIRDIPGESIIAGNMVTNLRQVMKDRGVRCRCIRCREVRDKKINKNNLNLKIINYKVNGGEEYFLSYESRDKKFLYGFCRLFLSNEKNLLINKNPLSIVRELHIYGELTSIGDKKIQHTGLGKKLLGLAEKISRENNYKIIVIISGIGVRDYYRKQGYRLKNSYMIKNI